MEWEWVVGLILVILSLGMMAGQPGRHGPQAIEEANKCHVTLCHADLKTSLKIRFRYLQEVLNIVSVHAPSLNLVVWWHFPSRSIVVNGRWHFYFDDLLQFHLYPRTATIPHCLFLWDDFYHLRFERQLKQVGSFRVQGADHYTWNPLGSLFPIGWCHHPHCLPASHRHGASNFILGHVFLFNGKLRTMKWDNDKWWNNGKWNTGQEILLSYQVFIAWMVYRISM